MPPRRPIAGAGASTVARQQRTLEAIHDTAGSWRDLSAAGVAMALPPADKSGGPRLEGRRRGAAKWWAVTRFGRRRPVLAVALAGLVLAGGLVASGSSAATPRGPR